MSKTDYINKLHLQLKSFVDGKIYINISQLAKAIGVSRETAARWVFKLNYLPNGREKLFLIEDVAIQIFNFLDCDSIGGMLID